MTDIANILMKKCIELAKKGEGNVAPNPMVGAVLANDCGEIISEGYHQKYGESHAEVNCLKEINPKGLTLYVNLEPCSHWGKTPPCVDLIIEKGVKKVVVGMSDPNPKVKGDGIKKLKDAGIEVIVGILEDECKDLNKVFVKNITTQKPFVAIKTATTLDGKIATSNGSSKWITSSASRDEVSRLRARYSATMTGSGTVLADDPNFETSPVRIVFDRHGKTPNTARVYRDDGKKVIVVKNFNDFDELFKNLYGEGIYSVLIEAGSGLNSALVEAKEVDWLYQFIAPKILGTGKSFVEGFDVEDINNCVKLEIREIIDFAPDVLLSAKFVYNERISESKSNANI